MEASLQLIHLMASISGNILPVVILCGGSSHPMVLATSTNPLFNSHQIHSQSWVPLLRLSKYGIWMVPTPLLTPIATNHSIFFLAVVLIQ